MRGVTTLRQLRQRAALSKKRAGRPKKALRKAIKKVIAGQAETKVATWFGGPIAAIAPSPPSNTTGDFTSAAPTSQNQFITANGTDILKVIPDVLQGTADNQRQGKQINVVPGSSLKCKVMISPTSTGSSGWVNGWAYDLTMVAYLLQSVSFKTYRTLYANNDFTKMLNVGDGTTVNFDGSYQAACLEVDRGYYQVKAIKKQRLRSSGQFNSPTSPGMATNNNSHPQVHEWTWPLESIYLRSWFTQRMQCSL